MWAKRFKVAITLRVMQRTVVNMLRVMKPRATIMTRRATALRLAERDGYKLPRPLISTSPSAGTAAAIATSRSSPAATI